VRYLISQYKLLNYYTIELLIIRTSVTPFSTQNLEMAYVQGQQIDLTNIIMTRLFIYCLAACLISACASTQKTQEELEKVTFIDVDIFDQDVSASMSAETEEITVSMLAPVSINQMPERLSKWLNVVSKKGGHIEITPKPMGKSATWLLGLLPFVMPHLKEEWLYGAATDYNAKIFYQPDTGKVEKVVFTQKK